MNGQAGRRPGLRQGMNCAVALLVIVGGAGLAGCTGQTLTKLAVCDGKHLRPGNPYGSILPGAPVPATPTPPAGPGSPISAVVPSAAGGLQASSAALIAPSPSC